MPITYELVNPTGETVRIPYERGISIVIDPDDSVELTVGQYEDYMPGKPGSEEVRKILDAAGVFLMDTDRSYDVQALEAIEKAIRVKQDQLNNFVTTIRNNRISSGSPIDDNALEEMLKLSGYAKMREDIEGLKRRATKLGDKVKADPERGNLKQSLDPKRTCFVLDPPKQFPSETALELFLEDHPEIREEHEHYMKEIISD